MPEQSAPPCGSLPAYAYFRADRGKHDQGPSMFDKAQQPMASHARRSGRAAARERKPRATPALSALGVSIAVPIAVLVFAAPASAAGPVTGLLDTVAKAATPAVTRAVPAVQENAPSPVAAQQAGEVAPATSTIEQTVSQATSSTGSTGNEPTDTTLHHAQSSGAAPADRTGTTPTTGPAEGPRASSAPAHGASSPGSTDGVLAPAPGRSPAVIVGLAHGAVHTVKQATAGTPHLPGKRLPRPPGETATRLVDHATPLTIVPLLRWVGTLTLPSLSLPALLPRPMLPIFALTPPALALLPPLPLPPATQPTGAWPPAAPMLAGEVERSATTPQQRGSPASSAGQMKAAAASTPDPTAAWTRRMPTGAPPPGRSPQERLRLQHRRWPPWRGIRLCLRVPRTQRRHSRRPRHVPQRHRQVALGRRAPSRARRSRSSSRRRDCSCWRLHACAACCDSWASRGACRRSP